MPPKPNKQHQENKTDFTSTYGESDDTFFTSRRVSLNVVLDGEPPSVGEWMFLAVFNGQIVIDGRWYNEAVLQTEALSLDLKDPFHQELVTDTPLVLLLRVLGGKGAKDPDPLINLDNRAGATVDLFPLLIGEKNIFVKVPLMYINTGQPTECVVTVRAISSEPLIEENTNVPLIMTLVSGHCLPMAKEGTVYMGAIGLDDVLESHVVKFGTSVSSADAEKNVWASVSQCGQAANSAISVPNEDKFFPEDLWPANNEECRSCYWNAMKRVLVNPDLLRDRLYAPFLLEVAGVPKSGKTDVRGRYMAFVDAGVLLQPGQNGVTVCSKLLLYNEQRLPDNVGGLLDLPPTSAKSSARDTDLIFDEYGHNAYIVIRFDVSDSLVPKVKIAALFETIGLIQPEGPAAPIDQLDAEPQPEDPYIDVRRIRKESGALAVHKELSRFACRGVVPMNQGIRKTAANRLIMRVRSMLKQFPPGACSYIDWQDIVTAQHAATRRAVTASFAPQPPPDRAPARAAAARCRIAGDNKIAEAHVERNLKFSLVNPRALLSKALRCLEEYNDTGAKNYILQGLKGQTRNRFLLWAFAGLEFDKGVEASEIAAAALRLAVKGDYSDGTANAIGWGALHTFWHFSQNPYGAFVAAKRMRKSYELQKEWGKFIQRWIEESGEEEVFWMPSVIYSNNPLLIAAAFFLCLRCYKFSERILLCVEAGCATKGSRLNLVTKEAPDVFYLRAASLILQRQYDKALKVTTIGINKFGPSPMMSQMRAACLVSARGWDDECKVALDGAEKAESEPCPALLLRAAVGILNIDPKGALQRAARAHKITPCGHSALVIARIYAKMHERSLANRWAAVAVKFEPLLADGWALLSILAMYERNMDKAKTMFRTAKQLGTISPDMDEELQKMMKIVQLEGLPDTLVKDLCLCDYY